ncbi:Bug family tripartite tricarboxylate transporter substrate binding protein [Hydrogenophaga laconesensis]|uniref:Tripartite-type tricarboxylate transporter receptor subunit TctC n=1 Tax=Hydrogenophaga laconesensis TaxID=1805971 RepID=A0ABU1VC16_9BURK|nr:tripartite tricarboxylate transporter substrate binding protein [Hydrogenophaga laconesensis]MDR7094972.1 tripartite-type tricarboxylate transporter receptor subunit TctC [Hydrogenophaga laconesensis]
MNTRRALCLALLAGTAALPAFAQADYPNKPVRFIVNFPPGGTVDVLTRTVAQKLSERFGQPFVVENRAGAGGNIGAHAVATAAPDGYTLLASPPGPLSINQYLYKDMSFDPAKLAPIVLMAGVPNVITARANFPANSVQELIAYAKANPGKVTYGSQGNGSTSHLTGQMFATMTGADMLHIPFKGEGPALTELLGGRVDLFFGNISAVLKYRETKQVKLLGLAAPKRGSMAPDVPTVAEGGLADFNSSAWFALAAPPGTPAAIAGKLNAAMVDILNMPDVVQKFAVYGAEPIGGSGADMNTFIQAERNRWKKVIETAKVTVD